MVTDVILPVLGVSQEYGKILHWYKQEGQTVQKGDPLVEVETDKAVVDIESPASGVLAKTRFAEGQEIPVTEVIAVILTEEEISSGASTNPDPSVRTSAGSLRSADALPNRLLASPKARRLAAERGVNLADLKGSGPGGAVLADDIPVAISDELIRPAISSEPIRSAPFSENGETHNISNTWRIMAERTAQSWTSVPHFFLLREVNASRLVSWRESLIEAEGKISYTDLLVKVVAVALQRNPSINATWEDGTIVSQAGIHIGLVTAQDNGLVAPVIHNADQLTILQIAATRAELVAKARNGKLHPLDMSGGTFTISNLGMYGVDSFNAIINAPQAAILAVGRIIDRVTAMKGTPIVQPMVTLSLSCDHRVVDGVRGALFLETIAKLVEEPARMIL